MVRLDAQISSLRPGVLRTYQVWGTRANIGKTVATAILLRSIWEKRRVRHSIAKEGMHFVKPVCSSTAADHQPKRDNRWMRWAFNRCMPNNRMNDLFSTATIYQLDVNDLSKVSDQDLLARIREATKIAHQQTREILIHGQKGDRDRPVATGWLFMETFGGLETPLPKDRSQLKLYRALQDPAILVAHADHERGGLEEAHAAYEKLRGEGYDVQGVLFFGGNKEGDSTAGDAFMSHFKELDVHCVPLGTIPERHEIENKNRNIFEHWTSTRARSLVVRGLLDDLDAKFFSSNGQAMLRDEKARFEKAMAILNKAAEEEKRKIAADLKGELVVKHPLRPVDDLGAALGDIGRKNMRVERGRGKTMNASF